MAFRIYFSYVIVMFGALSVLTLKRERRHVGINAWRLWLGVLHLKGSTVCGPVMSLLSVTSCKLST